MPYPWELIGMAADDVVVHGVGRAVIESAEAMGELRKALNSAWQGQR